MMPGVESRAGNANAKGHGVAKSHARAGGRYDYAVKIASVQQGKVNLFERSFKHYVKLHR